MQADAGVLEGSVCHLILWKSSETMKLGIALVA
jgi:hypothetical protein